MQTYRIIRKRGKILSYFPTPPFFQLLQRDNRLYPSLLALAAHKDEQVELN